MSKSRLGCHLRLGTPTYGKSRVLALVNVLTGLLLANLITDGSASHLAYGLTADSSIDFAENGTGPVGVFRAYGQDRNVIKWSLSGPDADRFTIKGGVLAFRQPPNYEETQSAAAGAAG